MAEGDFTPRPLVHFVGNLGDKPRTRKAGEDREVVEFSLGVRMETGKDAETVWYDATIWDEKLGKKALEILYKGSGVALTATRGQDREYEGKVYRKLNVQRLFLTEKVVPAVPRQETAPATDPGW